MAVEDVPTQPTQQSTQSTQDASSQERAFTDSDIWGSLIPFNASNPHASRIDFLRSKHKYAFGRSRREGVNDISFPYFFKMSQRHCTIEWDGEETATSAVTVRDLNSSNGTFIGGRRLRQGEYQILRDWDVISFSAPCDKSTNKPRDDYRFFFRHMASRQRPKDGLYKYYDVQHVLGKGAYATVVKALHRMEGKSYAIKMFSSGRLRELLSSSSSSRGMKERMQSTATHLRREVHVLQGMDHPYICQLKEAFFEEYSVSVVLELVPGGDLMTYVIKREGLIEPEAQYFTYQICEGLAYVHGKGVVHRDLKPENVLLTDDHPPIVKIADFGLAKVIDSLSVMQTKCGTPIFIAPEVVDQSPEGYDKIVDSWSVGVMIYMMIARATPFHDDARDGPDWDLMREYEISDDGIDFIGRLLEYDPRRRMTPAQCLEHPWIVPQGRLQRARMLEREESFRRAAAREETTPSAPAPGLDEAGPPAGGAKRKAGAMLALGRSLSTLAVDVDDRDGGPPAAKRVRGEDGAPRIPDQPGSSATAWTPSSVVYDEVPGLGRWQSGSS